VAPGEWRLIDALAIALGVSSAQIAFAQEAPPATEEPDIVVRAARLPGSIDTDILPTGRFDADAIRNLGVTSVGDFVKKLGLAREGAPPIYTLNGRLPSGPEEIFLLPMEAFQQIETFPEAVATKFGYPPTRPVLNFITKARFDAIELKASYQAATEGGTATPTANINLTRIRDQRRLSLTASYSRTSQLRQDERRIAPDPAVYFDTIGNVGGTAGGEIDPRLSALAGAPIRIAPVPADLGGRSDLIAYAEAAGTPRITDTAAFRTLVPDQESWKLGSAIAGPIGANATASLSASLERKSETSLQGLPTAIVPIARGNSYSPFDRDVLLYRYLGEAGPVRQRGTSTIARVALAGSGSFGGWGWNVLASADRQQLETVTLGNIDLAGTTARIAAGDNPFAPLAIASHILPAERSRTVFANAEMRAVMNGTMLALPAGYVTVTVAAFAQQSWADRTTRATSASTARLGRLQSGASIALDAPLTAGFSLDAKAGITGVSRFGSFLETSYGLNWKPLSRVQLTASVANARGAPPLASLASPVVTTPNTPFFDFVTGESVLVTSFAGGNPALDSERRRTASINLGLQPIANSELRVQIGYIDTRIDDQVGMLSTLTSSIQEAFPDAYVRGPLGQLISVNFQPVNFAAENQRDLSATIQYFGNIGKAPSPDAKAPPRERVGYFLWFNPRWRLKDTLLLRRGLETLDLLDGDTVGGTGGPARLQLAGSANLFYRGANLGFSPNWRSATRVRSADPASDLTFSSLLKLGMDASLMFDALAPKWRWARRTFVSLSVDNLLNDRQRVTDRNGNTPNRYQPAWLDPQGRTIQLSLRKLF
jgi:hypothetical protein